MSRILAPVAKSIKLTPSLLLPYLGNLYAAPKMASVEADLERLGERIYAQIEEDICVCRLLQKEKPPAAQRLRPAAP